MLEIKAGRDAMEGVSGALPGEIPVGRGGRTGGQPDSGQYHGRPGWGRNRGTRRRSLIDGRLKKARAQVRRLEMQAHWASERQAVRSRGGRNGARKGAGCTARRLERRAKERERQERCKSAWHRVFAKKTTEVGADGAVAQVWQLARVQVDRQQRAKWHQVAGLVIGTTGVMEAGIRFLQVQVIKGAGQRRRERRASEARRKARRQEQFAVWLRELTTVNMAGELARKMMRMDDIDDGLDRRW